MTKKWVPLICIVALIVGVLIGHFAWSTKATVERSKTVERSETITIYHAGSLAVPFQKMEKEFEKTHPNVDVLLESGGSNKMISQAITHEEAGELPPDIIASADYSLIPGRLYEPGYADWYITFARNGMVLCYRDNAPGSADIKWSGNPSGTRTWYDVLRNDNVKYGHSNPEDDPCGYRTLMVVQLAEKYYYDKAANFGLTPDEKANGLYAALIGGADDPLHAGRPEYHNDREVVSSKSVDLISSLQSGNLDYAFEYRSVAVEHKVKFIELADAINLSKTGVISNSIIKQHYEGKDGFYHEASIVLKTKPDKPEYGEPTVYGITIPTHTPNKGIAMEFITLLLSDTGQHIMTDVCGQPSISPALCDAPENLPMAIKKGTP